ncbi:MAG: 50S ribosomal protein L27, partial [Pseudomonadota bacterium]
PGSNVGMGKDHTIFAKSEGNVEFRARGNGRTYISVVPAAAPAKS